MLTPPAHDPLADAADRFANVLRLYAESSMTVKSLFATDPVEAIDNHDRAFDALLAGMHSVYDAMTGKACPLNWFDHGEMAACILTRNARHHNLRGLFQSWNSLMLKQGGLKRMAGAAFLMVGYELIAGEGRISEYYVPWDDFRAMLALPKAESRIKDSAAVQATLDRDCAFGCIDAHRTAERYPPAQVFVNLIPMVLNSATRVFSALKSAGLMPNGFDWRVYDEHFAAAPLTNLTVPTFKMLRAP